MAAICVTISTAKVKQMPGFCTWIILLINQSEKHGEKQFSVFGSRGGQISPLMHAVFAYDVDRITDRIVNIKAAQSTQIYDIYIWFI